MPVTQGCGDIRDREGVALRGETVSTDPPGLWIFPWGFVCRSMEICLILIAVSCCMI